METLYHVLWELVHVFFDHRGLLEGREARRTHDTGASSFLYPFLAETRARPRGVVDDVRARCWPRPSEVGELRAQTLTENREELLAAAAAACGSDLDAGGRLLALGNGGSATDAMDAVADFRHPPDPRWPPRRALDLTEDAAILTAIANDIGHGGDLRPPGDRARPRRRRPARHLHERELGERDRRARRGALARLRHDRDGRLRRRPGGRRAARRPRGRDALGAHPADPGGAGERLPRAAGAGGAGA